MIASEVLRAVFSQVALRPGLGVAARCCPPGSPHAGWGGHREETQLEMGQRVLGTHLRRWVVMEIGEASVKAKEKELRRKDLVLRVWVLKGVHHFFMASAGKLYICAFCGSIGG